MIHEIRYKNFKALKDTTLPLGKLTLIIGANGTGKSSALKALDIISQPNQYRWTDLVSAGADNADNVLINIKTSIKNFSFEWTHVNEVGREVTKKEEPSPFMQKVEEIRNEEISNISIFSFDPLKISQSATITPNTELRTDGGNLAGVLDFLRDTEPERWEMLNDELTRWFPEFDQILFDRHESSKSIMLRTRAGKHRIRVTDLSHGIIMALAYLTVAYLPNPPKVVCFEEPENGLHPRMLRYVQEAMYRLAYPENFNDNRKPIQVIAITHSPYLLDLYKDHPEEIVIASKGNNGVRFERLIDKPHIGEILQGEPLGEVWFTGILGGIPANI